MLWDETGSTTSIFTLLFSTPLNTNSPLGPHAKAGADLAPKFGSTCVKVETLEIVSTLIISVLETYPSNPSPKER